MRFFLSILTSVFCTLSVWGQSLIISGATNFGSATENSTITRTLTLYNQGNQTVSVNGYDAFWPFSGKICWLSDSVFSIPAGGQRNVQVYFRPRQNIDYTLPLIFHTDSHYGSVPVTLQGQGNYSKTYYNSTQGLSGLALKNQLQNLLAQNYNQLSYNSARDNMYAQLDNYQGAVSCVYTGRTAFFSTRSGANANNINCEHTMPQSYFGSAFPMQSDIHCLFPTDATANSVRSNYPFGHVSNPTWQNGGSKYASGLFEPRNVQKGNSARALLYFALRYGDYQNFISGMESVLRQWHLNDPPDAAEQTRNQGIYQLQNNRNPLVDYPQMEERLGSFTGQADLNPVSDWQVSPDTLWLGENEQACISLINTGDQNLQLSGTSGQNANFQLGNVPGQIGAYQSYCLTVDATGNTAFGPTALNISSPSHPNRVVYIASNGGGAVGGPTPPSLDGFSADSSGTDKAILTLDKPNAGHGTDWDGTIVFLSEQPINGIWQQNSQKAALYSPSSTMGAGSSASVSGGSAYCVYNSQNAQDAQLVVTGLQAGTTYYAQAFLYAVQSGSTDAMGAALSDQLQTRSAAVQGGSGNCSGGLIISEYIEGSSNNKCLELTNTSDSTLDLSDFVLYTAYNATGFSGSRSLSGTLNAGAQFVVCNSSAAPAFLNRADAVSGSGSALSFNGNDLTSLIDLATGDTIDRIGDPNNRGANHTIVDDGIVHDIQNVTLVRADSIRDGRAHWSRLRSQWHALSNNTYDSLGSHSLQACAATAVQIVPYAYSPFRDRFGEAVDIDQNWAVSGSPGRPGSYAELYDSVDHGFLDDLGAVYVFHLKNGQWLEWQRLLAMDRDASDLFGASVQIYSDQISVAAPGESNSGKVYLHRLNSLGQWVPEATLQPQNLQDGQDFGKEMALDGNTLIVSAPNLQPELFIYQEQTSGWTLTATESSFSSLATSEFGSAMDLKNDTVVVGAPGHNGQGSVVLYRLVNGSLAIIQQLFASDGSSGRRFGHSVCRDGNQLLVGDPNAEKVYLFEINGSTWTETQILQAPQPKGGDHFGSVLSYSLQSGKLLIGAEGADDGAGQVHEYTWNGSSFVHQGVIAAPDAAAGMRFGHDLSEGAGNVLIGAPLSRYSPNSASSSNHGAVYFNLSSGN